MSSSRAVQVRVMARVALVGGAVDAVVQVRVMAHVALVGGAVDAVVDALEAGGYEVVEQSREYPCADGADRRRIYVTAIKLMEAEDDGQK